MSDVSTGEGTETSSTVTEDDVLASRERVNALRMELAEVGEKAAAIEASRTQEVRKAALDREAASLELQLQQARQNLEVAQVDAGPIDTGGESDTETNVSGVFTGSNVQPDVNQETGEVEADQVRAFMAAADGEDYTYESTDTDGSSLADVTDDEQ